MLGKIRNKLSHNNSSLYIVVASALFQGVIAIANFMAQRIIFGKLTIQESADLFWIQRIISFGTMIFVDLGLVVFTTSWLAKEPKHKPEILGSLLLQKVISTLFVAVIAIIYALKSNFDIAVVLLLLFGWVLSTRSNALRAPFEVDLRAQSQITLISLLYVTESILYLVSIFFFKDSLTLHLCSLLFFISTASVFVITVFSFIKRSIPLKLSTEAVKTLWGSAKPTFVSAVLLATHDFADSFFLRTYCNAEELATYAVCARMILPIGLLYNTIVQNLVPKFVDNDSKNINQQFINTMLLIVACVTSLGAFIFSIFPNQIIFLIAGNQLTYNQTAYLLFLWTMVFITFNTLIYILNITLQKPHINIYVILIMAIVSILGNAVLTSKYGANGSIITKLLSTISGILLWWWMIRKEYTMIINLFIFIGIIMAIMGTNIALFLYLKDFASTQSLFQILIFIVMSSSLYIYLKSRNMLQFIR